MRGRLLMLGMLVGAFAIGGAGATPNALTSSCTPEQKSQREAMLAAFSKHMPALRKSYFAHHKSAKLRRVFVRHQKAHLKQLQALAACTVPQPPTDAARLAGLGMYADAMTELTPLFDPGSAADADDALDTITTDIEDCQTDPEDFDCPVPLSEYQDAATSLRDAAGELKALAAMLGAITPPTMTVGEYSDEAQIAATDCGVDLTTIAAAHAKFLDTTNKWVSTLTTWADTYAAGKSVDWNTLDYVPGDSAIWDEPEQALELWSFMVTSYWSSLAQHVASPPEVPTWISDYSDDECP